MKIKDLQQLDSIISSASRVFNELKYRYAREMRPYRTAVYPTNARSLNEFLKSNIKRHAIPGRVYGGRKRITRTRVTRRR